MLIDDDGELRAFAAHRGEHGVEKRRLGHEDVDSVSGIVLTLLGRPPRVGDAVVYGRLLIDVTSVKGRGVDEVAVTLRGSGDDAAG